MTISSGCHDGPPSRAPVGFDGPGAGLLIVTPNSASVIASGAMESDKQASTGTTRREFIKQVAAATALAATFAHPSSAQTDPATNASPPWYRRCARWGQTNITEADVDRYDIAWWRQHWKRTEVQGVIINAGGIVAYYPSKFPLHYRPPELKERDLFGELATAAHDDGLAVLARMDSSKVHEPLYRAHPDWFAVDS